MRSTNAGNTCSCKLLRRYTDIVDRRRDRIFYRYEEYEMLAQIVMRMFEKGDYTRLSAAEMEIAQERHDCKKMPIDLQKFITI